MTQKFKQYASNMGIMIKNVFVKIHHFIDQIERYHEFFRRIDLIIISKILDIDSNQNLQMTFKAINDSIESHDLVLTLLILDAYSRMNESNAFVSSITQRSIAMKKAMDEIRKLNVNRQVNDVINTKNEFSTIHFHDLSFNAPVLIYWKKSRWKGPYKLLNMKNESTLLDLSNGPIKFRATSVKPYYDSADGGVDTNTDDQGISGAIDFSDAINSSNEIVHPDLSKDAADRISENSPDNQPIASIIRNRGRPRKHSIEVEHTSFNICFIFNTSESVSEPASESIDSIADLNTQKLVESTANFNLSSYTALRQKEISELLKKKKFKFINHAEVFFDARIFNFRFVNEMKNVDTEKTYEKSRLMMQTYNDQIKNFVLTQSSTIQRVSQRLIICFASIVKGWGMVMMRSKPEWGELQTAINISDE